MEYINIIASMDQLLDEIKKGKTSIYITMELYESIKNNPRIKYDDHNVGITPMNSITLIPVGIDLSHKEAK